MCLVLINYVLNTHFRMSYRLRLNCGHLNGNPAHKSSQALYSTCNKDLTVWKLFSEPAITFSQCLPNTHLTYLI